MKNVILHVTYVCKPGMAEPFVRALKEQGLQDAVRAEDGCMQYDYHISCEVPDTVVLLEMWRDMDALKVHSGQPHMKDILKLKQEYTTDTRILRFD